jgi:hypothetical protein
MQHRLRFHLLYHAAGAVSGSVLDSACKGSRAICQSQPTSSTSPKPATAEAQSQPATAKPQAQNGACFHASHACCCLMPQTICVNFNTHYDSQQGISQPYLPNSLVPQAPMCQLCTWLLVAHKGLWSRSRKCLCTPTQHMSMPAHRNWERGRLCTAGLCLLLLRAVDERGLRLRPPPGLATLLLRKFLLPMTRQRGQQERQAPLEQKSRLLQPTPRGGIDTCLLKDPRHQLKLFVKHSRCRVLKLSGVPYPTAYHSSVLH